MPGKDLCPGSCSQSCKIRKLIKQPCEVCQDPQSQAHHYKGYDHPLEVRWLCRKHHIEAEKKSKEIAA